MPPDTASQGRRLSALAALACLALALLYLWPLALHPSWVAFPPRSNFTDLLLSHWPNAQYLRDSLARYGQWPLWNDQIFAGLPFAADPLSGMWYPPALALLVLPLPLGFNLLLAAHLAWAGWGMFQFLRAEGLGTPASALGAAAFAGTPKLVAHLGAGHVSLVYAVAWTPWLLLAMRAAVAGPAYASSRPWTSLARGATAGTVMAITFLADVRWAFYAGLLALAYGVVTALTGDRQRRVASEQSQRRGYLYALAGFGFFFLAFSAVLALPLVELTRLASRGALTLADGGTYSLPPIYLLGLLIPDLGGFAEWMTYLGVVPLLLALGGLGQRTWLWWAVALLAAAYSLGTNFVVFPVVFRFMPLASLLRVPPRAWFLVSVAAAVLAGHGLQRLLEEGLPWLRRRYAGGDLTSPAPLPLREGGRKPQSGEARQSGAWVPSARTVAVVLLALTVLDLARVDSTLMEVRPAPALPPASIWLRQQPGLFRVYSPSYSLPYDDGLQHVDGVDPLQLSDALAVIGPATGVVTSSYSVTVPPFGSDDLASANASASLSAHALARLDVKYVAAEFDLHDPGFEKVQTFGSTRIYWNQAWLGRAWVEGAVAGQAAAPASVSYWSPNRVEVQADGPGRLVLSEIIYPGWQAWVDGQPAPIVTADGALRAVPLAAGRHQVTFEFRPFTLTLGAALTGLGLLLYVLLPWTHRPR